MLRRFFYQTHCQYLEIVSLSVPVFPTQMCTQGIIYLFAAVQVDNQYKVLNGLLTVTELIQLHYLVPTVCKVSVCLVLILKSNFRANCSRYLTN